MVGTRSTRKTTSASRKISEEEKKKQIEHAKRIWAWVLKDEATKAKYLKKPRVSSKTRRLKKIKEKCPGERTEISEKFKAAVPSANKIQKMDYDGFLKLKKDINKHLAKVRAHAKRCNDNFNVPQPKKRKSTK